MTDLVEEVLASVGPCLSTDLVAALQDRYNLQPAAARQRLSRNRNIKRLGYLTFPRKARFVYLQSQYGSPSFWIALTQALFEHTLGYGCALASMMSRKGIVPTRHFEIACGSPQAQKRHLSAGLVLNRLVQAELLQRIDISGVGECIQLSQKVDPETREVHRLSARLQTEKILLLAIKHWAKNLGLVSYNSAKVRDEQADGTQPKVGTFLWDLSGPSYLAPLLGWSDGKAKQGFVVCDVLLDVQVTALDIKPFLQKCETLRNLKGVGRCIQILVADEYDSEAFKLAKSKGIIPATPKSLFGEDVARALLELSALLREVWPRAGDAERLDKLFTQLSKIEGVATNLRGALFEFVCADVIRQVDGHKNIQMNVAAKVPELGAAEVDLLVDANHRTVRFVECRGYQPSGEISLEMMKRWLDEKVPLIRQWALLQSHLRDKKMSFELWTSGRLAEDARQHFEQASALINPNKYVVKLVDSAELENLSMLCDSPLRNTLSQHFFEHPFVKIDRQLEEPPSRQQLREGRFTKREREEEHPFAPVELLKITHQDLEV